MTADAPRQSPPGGGGGRTRTRSRTPAAWAVLLGGVLVTLAAWRWSVKRVESDGADVFARQVQLVTNAISERLAGYETVLRSSAGFVLGSYEVEREEWARFVAQMDIPERYPGIQVLSLVERVPAAELAAHEGRVRAEGFADYRVRPVGPRDEYYPIVYLEPMASNQAAFGFDVLSEPVRRVALEYARDSGRPAITSGLVLVQDASVNGTPAVIMYAPLYRDMPAAPTVAERRAALRGFVTAAIRVGVLMQDILPSRLPGVEFAIYDDVASGPPLYDDAPGLSSQQPRFAEKVTLAPGGRTWVLAFSSLPEFEASLDRGQPIVVLFGCLTVSVLLFGILRTQGLSRERAMALADERTVQLREREARLRAIVDNEPECVKVVSRQGIVLEMNPAGVSMLGATSAAEVVGRPVLDFVHPDDRAARQSLHEQVVAGATDMLSFRVIDLRGGLHWVESSSVPLRDAHGRVTSVLSVTRDVTRRKEADDRLRQTTAELEAVFRAVPDLFFRVRVDGTILDFRGGEERDLYLPPMRFLGRKMTEVLPLSVAGELGAALATVHETGQPATIEYALPTERGEGMFEARVLRLHEDQLLVVARNITERKQAEVERARLEARLRRGQRLEAMGALAGGIAHDFNNILGCILGFAELTRADCSDRPRADDNLANVLLATQRARELVEQIVAFSQQQELERRPVALGSIVEGAIRLIRAGVPASIAVRVSIAPDLPLVLADATQMHQVLMNLATNAVQAMEGGEGRLEIDLERVTVTAPATEIEPGDYVRLVVRDTGHGMDAEMIERIFEPFFTTKRPGKGTGLGLSVVHGIVTGHEGTILVRSARGYGTTFEVYLPVYEGAVPESSDRTEVAETVPGGRGEHILLVDDEVLLLDAGRRMLESLGYQVMAFSNPVEALAAFRTRPHTFTLAMVDLAMPELGGLELGDALLGVRPDLPILLNTGFGGGITAEAARRRGFRDLLLKPVSLEALGRAVHEALRSRPTVGRGAA